MKKYLLLILCLFIMAGCGKTEINTEEVEENTKEEETVIVVDTPKYVDDNPIKVGLYKNGERMDTYSAVFNDGEDLASFDVYFTDLEHVEDAATKYNFNKYYANYENIDKYRIGFDISFEADGKTYHQVVKDASNEFALSPYIYIYLYDDIHQADGAWYSHVEEDEFNENTMFTTIKLYVAGWAYQISTPITVKVFTYDGEEDFDEEGNYRGVSSHTLTISKK